MTFKIAVQSFQTPTSTGTQNITTTDLGGLTPKAVLFILTHVNSLDTSTDHAIYSIGAATAADEEWATGQYSLEGYSQPNTGCYGYDDSCVRIHIQAIPFNVEANFTQWLTNGCQITWTGVHSSLQYQGAAIFFAGTSMQAYAGWELGPAVSGSVNVTAPGFRPNVVLCCMKGEPESISDSSDSYPGFGVAIDKATDEHGSVASFRDKLDAPGPTLSSLRLSDTYTYMKVDTDGALVYAFNVDSWDANGFSFNHESGASVASDQIGYLAIDTGFFGVAAKFIDTPTTVSTQGYTGFGFQPQSVILVQSLLTSITGVGSGNAAAAFGFGVATSTDEYSASSTDKDNVSPDPVCKTKFSAVAGNICDEDGNAELVALLDSLDSDGFTLDFTTVNGSANKWLAIAFSESASVFVSPIIPHFRL